MDAVREERRPLPLRLCKPTCMRDMSANVWNGFACQLPHGDMHIVVGMKPCIVHASVSGHVKLQEANSGSWALRSRDHELFATEHIVISFAYNS